MGASQCGARPCSSCHPFGLLGGKKRVLLTGASGLLGRQVMKLLKSKYEIRGLYSTRQLEGLVCADLLNEGEIENQFTEFHPDVVIHCAAERRPDVCHQNKDKSKQLNVNVTKSIAEACQRNNAWLINISTDYVFNGTSPPYQTDDKTDPLSDYGEQKKEGEDHCRTSCPSSATVRVPLLFGPIEYVKESAVTNLYLELRKEGVKDIDHDQLRYPTYTCDVARVIEKMLEVHFSGKQLSGIYHWQAEEQLTKYDMVQKIAGLFELPATEDHIRQCMTPPAVPRPHDSRLDCSRLERDLGIDGKAYRTPFDEALKETFESIPKKIVASDIHSKLEKTITITKEELERMLGSLKIPRLICDKEIQRLMNMKGKITQGDYQAFLKHFAIDGK